MFLLTKNNIIPITICFLFMNACFMSCATYELPKINPMAVSTYSYYSNVGALSVAVEPYFDAERVKQAFGINLIASGILPIFMVIENRTSAIYLVQKKEMSLYSRPIGEDQGQAIAPRMPVGERVWGILASLHVVPGLLISMPFLAYSGYKRDVVTQQIIMNELPDKTIPPGESLHGFLYVQISGSGIENSTEPLVFRTTLKDVTNGEVAELTFEIVRGFK